MVMQAQFALPAPVLDVLAQRGVALDAGQVSRLELLARELLDWNLRMNLTSITDPAEVAIKHLLDSLVILPIIRTLYRDGPLRLFDVGSGAGFPGLPLAIAMPALEVTLIEATGKKVDFMRHAIEVTATDNARPIKARAEELAHEDRQRGSAELVTARAVASVAVLCELTLPFLASGGHALLWKAMPSGAPEVEDAGAALNILGGALREVADVSVPGMLEARVCVVIEKTRPTPDQYPRRSGVPQRRPI
jgi:16S rRNA (guanine527-N7)-methyltransferase